MNKNQKLEELRQIIDSAELSIQQARQILADLLEDGQSSSSVLEKVKELNSTAKPATDQIIEGVFNGQLMIGPDGKEYSVPANYASKSKLVEGDILKLTIKDNGSFVFKQIGPVERERVIGKLVFDEKDNLYKALANGHAYSLLNASVTYFKGQNGDQVTLLVPKDTPSAWAAVENIIKNPEPDETDEFQPDSDLTPINNPTDQLDQIII